MLIEWNGDQSVRLRSVYPLISPAAWTTFATGHNPGKHGVYDFRDYDNSRYSCFADTIVDSNGYSGKPLNDLFEEMPYIKPQSCLLDNRDLQRWSDY